MKDKLLKHKLVDFTFGIDKEGNLVRIPLRHNLYEEVDDLIRPEGMKAENPDEFIN